MAVAVEQTAYLQQGKAQTAVQHQFILLHGVAAGAGVVSIYPLIGAVISDIDPNVVVLILPAAVEFGGIQAVAALVIENVRPNKRLP